MYFEYNNNYGLYINSKYIVGLGNTFKDNTTKFLYYYWIILLGICAKEFLLYHCWALFLVILSGLLRNFAHVDIWSNRFNTAFYLMTNSFLLFFHYFVFTLLLASHYLYFNPYTTATNNIGQKYNGPEYRYQ